MSQKSNFKKLLVILVTVILLASWATLSMAGFAADLGKNEAVQEGEERPIVFLPQEPRFVAVSTPDGQSFLVVRRRINVYQPRPKQITIPVTAVNLASGGELKLLQLVVSDKSGRVRLKLTPNATLESVADLAFNKEELLTFFEQPGKPGFTTLTEKSYTQPVVVPIGDLGLEEGDSLTLLITATFGNANLEQQTTAETLVAVTSLPSRPNWYAGDGHIHTSWSDGGSWNTPNRHAADAKADGFKWIIITDHEDLIRRNGGWSSYVSEINAAQSNNGIVVAPGAKIGCVQIQGDESSPELGHALGYRLQESATSIPKNKYYTPQNLINAINNHNYPYSYPVIAHPYHGTTWQDWSVTGFRAIELISCQWNANSSTISRWVSLLRAGLSNTIAGKGFVVGVGNTDAHYFHTPGSDGASWIYAPKLLFDKPRCCLGCY